MQSSTATRTSQPMAAEPARHSGGEGGGEGGSEGGSEGGGEGGCGRPVW